MLAWLATQKFSSALRPKFWAAAMKSFRDPPMVGRVARDVAGLICQASVFSFFSGLQIEANITNRII